MVVDVHFLLVLQLHPDQVDRETFMPCSSFVGPPFPRFFRVLRCKSSPGSCAKRPPTHKVASHCAALEHRQCPGDEAQTP